MSKTLHYGRRTPQPAFLINKGKDFHDDMGMLKEGYNTTGGEGMVAVGTTTTTGTVGAGKDGMTAYSEQKIVFGPKDIPQKEAPAFTPEAPVAEEQKPVTPYRLSQRAAEANAGVAAYEQVLLNQQGTSAINNNPAPEQAFKNAYQANLTNELKAKAPGALADKVNGIQQSDVQAAVNGDFGLNLAKSGMQPGQAGKRGLEFT